MSHEAELEVIIAQQRKHIEEMKELLREIEWSATQGFWSSCPCCKAARIYTKKHGKNCKLAKFIKE